MSKLDLQLVKASPDADLRRVLEVVDRSASSVALLVDEYDVLIGLLTDGDVRRALLSGASLDDPALRFASTDPYCVAVGSPRALVLDLMRARRIVAVPETDERGRLVGLHTVSDVIGTDPLGHPAVIMAGGRGVRLGRLTRDRPKPLMEVAGRSILEWILLTLVGGGVRDVYISLNHMGDQIERALGTGERYGCSLTYLWEDRARPLGTAGSLSLFRELRPDLEVPALVMNGDLMVQLEPGQLLEHHERHGADVTVATRAYQHEVPFGVVTTADGSHEILSIAEKPTFSVDVNAGVYAVSPQVLDRIPKDTPTTMPELVEDVVNDGGRVVAWPLSSEWIDVGTPTDLARAKGHV